MQINIKSIGYKVGTSGWIKEQLESGAAAIREGLGKETKKHGLWLHYNNNGLKQVCLAIWDEYDIGESRYRITDQHLAHTDWAIFTPAVRAMLTSVAQQWVNGLNEARENDPDIGATISRVTVAIAA